MAAITPTNESGTHGLRGEPLLMVKHEELSDLHGLEDRYDSEITEYTPSLYHGDNESPLWESQFRAQDINEDGIVEQTLGLFENVDTLGEAINALLPHDALSEYGADSFSGYEGFAGEEDAEEADEEEDGGLETEVGVICTPSVLWFVGAVCSLQLAHTLCLGVVSLVLSVFRFDSWLFKSAEMEL
ncbi:hypothetical protein SUGI_1046690 [Cryptomeria japonica]|nr:hypothetical protein SUGI_1046690 [Cryptomeria japonica]